ncbi:MULTISPECIES: chemotaxis protein [Enterobacteriaceae]|uniref:chemotaxis protein n=1 Tax=Enterobacteriaceae TaxID=543 RepID=UPI000E4F193D|nr:MULTISPECIES: chemotaxis protein [Enterobacteriaceae]MBC4166804.1 chemotaxis protein [Klebsiella quasipneumoniae]MBX8481339.1 chemotaxis protein [Klebsiella quasipneumoniae subsp. similipneumoniae]MBX9413403.1 chemotaxis protein [Klebsiella quasipneumoniae subsp. similipneumoniae]MBX9419626.1 chemotaxis protein [Klebsiella quasipneumoniae subsp. similipneumoniae]MDG0554846.1 chemotaxis protein [Klebsiella quasipneumoniae]
MSGTNKIVTSTVNEISWITDDASYQKAKKKIISLKAAHEKPAKALEKAQKRTAQSEGKAALAAAKAQTAKLRQAEQLSKQQQKQAQIQAKMERDAIAHANKMTSLQARQLSQQEQAARQNARLAAISEKVRQASRSRAMTYNPNMGGQHYDPGLVSRQTEAMNRGHGAVAADIAATKKAMALEEKRQREKEAGLKREVTYYNSLRRSALTLANVNGADVATRYKAISAAKEALKAQKEERYTVEETRFEMARITTELRKQARLQQRITREQKTAGVRAGRVRTESRGGSVGLAAAGVIGGAALVGSMGVSRVGQTLQGSLERSRDVKKLQQYGISNLEFAALQDLSMSRVGYSLSADKLADLNKDTTEKAGELLNTGSFKRNKKTGQVNFSGGGEFADIINNVLTSTNGNQKVAQKVIGELQKLDFPTFITYLKQLQKTFKWTNNQTRHLAEAVNDGSVFLEVFNDEGQGLIQRMHQLASEGWTLSDAQQANLDKLAALGAEYNRVQTSLADHFSASFVEGLGQYAANTDTLRQNMTGLIPISDALGVALGELTTNILSFAGRVGEELKKGATLPDAVYTSVVDDSANGAADWIKEKTGFDPRSIGQTLKQIYPWLNSSASSSIGSGTAYNVPALALNVPGLNYLTPQQPTFTVPTIDSMTQRQPIPVSVTGQANINQQMDVFVHDDKIAGLVDTKIRENNQAQNNLILGIAD